jgi:hypothetical protein
MQGFFEQKANFVGGAAELHARFLRNEHFVREPRVFVGRDLEVVGQLLMPWSPYARRWTHLTIQNGER